MYDHFLRKVWKQRCTDQRPPLAVLLELHTAMWEVLTSNALALHRCHALHTRNSRGMYVFCQRHRSSLMLLSNKVHREVLQFLKDRTITFCKGNAWKQNRAYREQPVAQFQFVHHFSLTKVIYNANQISVQMPLINGVVQTCFLEYMISSVCAHLLQKANRQLGGPS